MAEDLTWLIKHFVNDFNSFIDCKCLNSVIYSAFAYVPLDNYETFWIYNKFGIDRTSSYIFRSNSRKTASNFDACVKHYELDAYFASVLYIYYW